MANLFMQFNPCIFYYSNMMLMGLSVPMLLIPHTSSTLKMSRHMSFYSLSSQVLMNQITSHFKMKNVSYLLISVLMLVVSMNLMGLIPYIPSPSASVSFSMSMTIPLWAITVMYGMLNRGQIMWAHLVPMASPMALAPFMVLIESISLIIRPITLAVRLTANIIAGHLLITLMSMMNSYMEPNILIWSETILSTLELSVAIIQGYILMLLLAIYISEIN